MPVGVQGRSRAVGAVATLVLTAALFACGSDAALTGDGSPSGAAATATTKAASTEDFEAKASDFRNLHTMTAVRGFFVDNRNGHLAEALRIARANKGGVYPVGTIIQLVPQEAMVKRRAGWSPATKDWEFFFLDTKPTGTTILARGKDNVVNRFDGNCASCHAAARPEFDFVCEDTHGCEPLPIGDAVIQTIQEADPRQL